MVQQKISNGFAGCVAIDQIVLLTGPGRPTSSQVSPEARLLGSKPVSPDGRMVLAIIARQCNHGACGTFTEQNLLRVLGAESGAVEQILPLLVIFCVLAD